jgi:hypothetical protein
MGLQPDASRSISQDADRSPWQILDTLALGKRAIDLTAPISLSEAVARLEALTEQEPSDPAMPYLTVSVKNARVVAEYNMLYTRSPDSPGLLGMVRPVFRGYVSGDDQHTQLWGWFGVNSLTRFLGFASLVLVVAFFVSALMHAPLGIGAAAWIVPAAFVVMCLLTKANGDDIGYIEKNLQYALFGDPAS